MGCTKITGNEKIKLGIVYCKDEELMAMVKERIKENDAQLSYSECLAYEYIITDAAKRFDINCDVLAKKCRRLKEIIAEANKEIKAEYFTLAAEPQVGIFACIKLPNSKLKELGLKDNFDLALYLASTIRVTVRSVQGMMISSDKEHFYFRVNFSSTPEVEMKEAFERLTTLAQNLEQNKMPHFRTIRAHYTSYVSSLAS